MSSKTAPPRLVAVVDVGSTAVRMIIAEVSGDGQWRRLDRAARPVGLGRDVFTAGSISRESMLHSVRVLSSFNELLEGWQVEPENIRVIATSAIREAKNRDIFLDRIRIRTGLTVNVIEGVEENHLTYLAVQNAIQHMRPQFARSGSLILEVGGGTSELMILNRGKMVSAHSLRIGTIRARQQIRPGVEGSRQIEDYLRENVRVTKEVLEAEFDLAKVRFFIAVGGEARLAARSTGEEKHDYYSIVRREAFNEFIEHVQERTLEELVVDLGVSYYEVESLLPALLLYKYFLEATSADHLIVPDVSIREGVLVSFALGKNHLVERQFYSQVIASALSLGKKYHFDEPHARHVADLALSFFDQFSEEHGLDRHARLLLEVGALLHDIGNFVRSSGHHKHSQYLVANSEIFGFSQEDIAIVSNIVRYHRKATPQSSHESFASLRRGHRLTVLKLGAILRVADALDRSHSQRVRSISVEVTEADVLLHCDYTGDVQVESYGIEQKNDMFEEVFGYIVKIV
ncbi:MAG: HD domain-containing protein [Spirochaetia bacterium]